MSVKVTLITTSATVEEGGEKLSLCPRHGVDPSGARELPLHLAIGMFDGVHIGHQAVLRQAVEAAGKESGHASAVLTFNPHPSRVLHPDGATSLLIPLDQRVHKMHAAGIEYVFVQRFTRDYAMQSAGEFVPGLVKVFPGLRSIHVGENFRFGAGRSGDAAVLRDTARAAGVELHALKRESLGGMAISSSRIRLALVEGSIDEVNAMLGHPYLVQGPVVPGLGLGRQIKFPTVNIAWAPEVLPRFGVYEVFLRRAGSEEMSRGIANYGLRPTIGEFDDPRLEVHLLDPLEIPVEGEAVEVALSRFIRAEKTFASIEELRKQIEVDVDALRRSSPGSGPVLPF